MKDLPIQNIFHITKFWLNKHNIDNVIREEALHLLKVILKQNYFQYNNQISQPEKGIAIATYIAGVSINLWRWVHIDQE
jgi:hypothetical protein